MPRIAYVNGRYVRQAQACVSIEDRGYQFADSVYEVCEVRHGRLVDERRHLDRLARSLGELRITPPMSRAAIGMVLRETITRNRVGDGLVYLQVTRGVAPREHSFPPTGVLPSVVVTARALDPIHRDHAAERGIAVITLEENRWPRVDIKATALLPNVLARQAARERGAQEAWFIDAAGYVTEGSSSTAWIVNRAGVILTRSAEHGILPGVTRAVLLEQIRIRQVAFEERPFTLAEAYDASEAFVTSASQTVMPVVRINDRPVGTGAPGPVAAALRQDFHRYAEFS